MLTVQRLRQLLHYDPETGHFTRLTQASNSVKIGDIAGWLHCSGYMDLKVDHKTYKAHRLAWFYMTGEWPKDQIDHRDLNKANNRWANLREATNSQNGHNAPCPKNSTSGFKGITWRGDLEKWRARIGLNGQRQHLGYFDTLEEAVAARKLAAQHFHGEFARS